MSFGSRLKELRKEAHLTQTDFGSAIGVSSTTISQYESDDRFPEQKTLIRICQQLSVSSDYLLGLSNVRETLKNYDSIIINLSDYSDEKYEALQIMARALKNRQKGKR